MPDWLRWPGQQKRGEAEKHNDEKGTDAASRPPEAGDHFVVDVLLVTRLLLSRKLAVQISCTHVICCWFFESGSP